MMMENKKTGTNSHSAAPIKSRIKINKYKNRPLIAQINHQNQFNGLHRIIYSDCIVLGADGDALSE